MKVTGAPEPSRGVELRRSLCHGSVEISCFDWSARLAGRRTAISTPAPSQDCSPSVRQVNADPELTSTWRSSRRSRRSCAAGSALNASRPSRPPSGVWPWIACCARSVTLRRRRRPRLSRWGTASGHPGRRAIVRLRGRPLHACPRRAPASRFPGILAATSPHTPAPGRSIVSRPPPNFGHPAPERGCPP